MLTIITTLNDYYLCFLLGHFATIEFLEDIKPPQAPPSINLNINKHVINATLSLTYNDIKNSPKRTTVKTANKVNYKFI